MINENIKKRTFFLPLFFIFFIFLIFTIINEVSASDMGTITVNTTGVIKLDNKNVSNFVIAKTYSYKKNHKKTNIKTKKGNKNYTYVTKYLLPIKWKNGGKNGKTEYWYNCQSFVISGKYIYVLTSSGYGNNKGFIIRYDSKLLDKLKLSSSKGLNDLRILGNSLENGKKLSKRQKSILKALKIGPIINVGHGQSLCINPKDKHLYLLQGNSNHTSKRIKMVKINMQTLKPLKTFEFRVKLKNKLLNKVKNLAFDKKGNFYFNIKTNNGTSSFIFKGSFIEEKLEIKLVLKLFQNPGTYIQGIAINHKLNKFYIFSDGAIYAIPLIKLYKRNLKISDFEWSIFNTKREFQGLSFDNFGRSYLLLIRGSEILKSTSM